MASRNTYYPSRLPYVADPKSLVRNGGRQIDWDQVPASFENGTEYTITVGAAGAAAGATAVPVDALPVAIPVGTVLYFGAGEFARLTAPAAVGDTELTVEALPAALEAADTATYETGGTGQKVIPAGTIMASLASGKVIPRSTVTGAETADMILETEAIEDQLDFALSGYGMLVGGVLYQNMLPDNGEGAFATWQGELNAAGVGLFVWQTYADDSAP